MPSLSPLNTSNSPDLGPRAQPSDTVPVAHRHFWPKNSDSRLWLALILFPRVSVCLCPVSEQQNGRINGTPRVFPPAPLGIRTFRGRTRRWKMWGPLHISPLQTLSLPAQHHSRLSLLRGNLARRSLPRPVNSYHARNLPEKQGKSGVLPRVAEPNAVFPKPCQP